ncbi:hypothetical protein AGMMS49975_07350 [Clostridia bacterium]|nr:hypothetical protein AGMMS49975_07350 [Clostridia bacterium]
MEFDENRTVSDICGDADTSSLALARRENNTKRTYLIVNKRQGKHFPCDPADTLKYFEELGRLVAEDCIGENVVVIGFAETATAIGAGVASCIPNSTYYHTTREEVKALEIVTFKEEHSHAVNQALYSRDGDFTKFDRIVFVEDEVTTGKTINNFLAALKPLLREDVKISVASLVNGFGASNEIKFGVSYYYLYKLNDINLAKKADAYSNFNKDTEYVPAENAEIRHIGGMKNPREGVVFADYLCACKELFIDNISGSVLVVGTEEFMYPALLLAKNIGGDVKFQATTRSPILPCSERGYPLFSRYVLRSCYDGERKTYIYNLAKYDNVVIVTDAKEGKRGLCDLCGALQSAGNTNITIYSWELR